MLHGYLEELYPHTIELNARTVAEAINGFCRQTKILNPIPGQDRHCISVLGFETEEALFAPTDVEEIHLVPDFSGGKGLFRILIGAALIAASFYFSGGLTLLGTTISASSLLWTGISMVLGGILEMMSPAPQADLAQTKEPEASKYLGAPGNTVQIGTRIMIGYGKRKWYGHYISFDVDAAEWDPKIADNPEDWPDPVLTRGT